MNELTHRIVEQVAREHLQDAALNNSNFQYYAITEWQNHLIAKFAPELQEFLFEILAIKIPHVFERAEGRLFIKPYEPWFYDLEILASHYLMEVLTLCAQAMIEYRLDDWGNLPCRISEPQTIEDAFEYWPAEMDRILAWMSKYGDCERVAKMAHKSLGRCPVDALLAAGSVAYSFLTMSADIHEEFSSLENGVQFKMQI